MSPLTHDVPLYSTQDSNITTVILYKSFYVYHHVYPITRSFSFDRPTRTFTITQSNCEWCLENRSGRTDLPNCISRGCANLGGHSWDNHPGQSEYAATINRIDYATTREPCYMIQATGRKNRNDGKKSHDKTINDWRSQMLEAATWAGEFLS